MSNDKDPNGFSEQSEAFRQTSKPIRPQIIRTAVARPQPGPASVFLASYGVYLCAAAILLLSKITVHWYIPAITLIVAARLWADRRHHTA